MRHHIFSLTKASVSSLPDHIRPAQQNIPLTYTIWEKLKIIQQKKDTGMSHTGCHTVRHPWRIVIKLNKQNWRLSLLPWSSTCASSILTGLRCECTSSLVCRMYCQDSPRTIWNMPILHTGEVNPLMGNPVCFGVLARSFVANLSVSRWRSAASFSSSFSCDSLNVFTMVAYPCRCVMGSHVSSFLSNPSQRTLYRVALTLSSPTCPWKSSPIPTICLRIHGIDPSVCCENAFHTGSKYDLAVRTVSFSFSWAKFLLEVFHILSAHPYHRSCRM